MEPYAQEEVFSLASGDRVEVPDKNGRYYCAGTIEIIAIELGLIWIYDQLGERKILDIREDNVRAAKSSGAVRPITGK